MTLSLAGIVVGFSFRNRRMAELVRRRYRGYCVTGIRPAMLFECVPGLPKPEKKNQRVTLLRTAQGAWHASRRDFDCSWSGRFGAVRLHPSIYAFDACLRVLYSTMLAEKGGMLMHASSVKIGRTAPVFPGPSGSGKTTISRLAGASTVLNDEIVAVSLSAKGRPCVWGTPFWGEMRTGPAWNRATPMQGVYFLQKGAEIFDSPIAPEAALRGLLRSCCLFGDDPVLASVILKNAIRLVTSVPVYRLHFGKKSDVAGFFRRKKFPRRLQF